MTTLLAGVNDVLERVDLIDSGNSLSTLTDSGRQGWIDQIVQIWNEEMERLYSIADKPMPQELAEATITLVTDDRDYSLSTYHTLYFPLLDETNGQFIYEYKDGYLALVNSQPIPADYTGLPTFAVIRPTDGQLYLDRIPTSSENGLVYKYRYDKDLSLSTAAGTFPFNDAVYRAMVPAVAEKFNLDRKREFAGDTYDKAMAHAARLLSGRKRRVSYGPQQVTTVQGVAAPFDE